MGPVTLITPPGLLSLSPWSLVLHLLLVTKRRLRPYLLTMKALWVVLLPVCSVLLLFFLLLQFPKFIFPLTILFLINFYHSIPPNISPPPLFVHLEFKLQQSTGAQPRGHFFNSNPCGPRCPSHRGTSFITWLELWDRPTCPGRSFLASGFGWSNGYLQSFNSSVRI